MTALGSFTEGIEVGNWTAPTTAVAEQASKIHGLDHYRENIDYPRLIAALQRISSDHCPTWIKIGMALKHESPGLFAVWEWWSKLSSKSVNCDLKSEWDGLVPRGDVTLGTIYHMAKSKEVSNARFETYTLDHLLDGDFQVTYLIDDILVAGQPCLCVGPQKVLKTTLLLYLALCLALGKEFLGNKCRKSRVLFMSGESGMATLQDTAKRQIESLGGKPDAGFFHMSPQLPRFDQSLDELKGLLIELKIEVLIVDPVYLSMNGSDAGNMFVMGQQLKNIADVCTELGITPILAHHSTKSGGKEHSPLELSEMAWSGFGEFARQWLMLSRRSPFVDGTGEHKLYLRIGGSAGHSNLIRLDVSEGVHPNRHWNIDTKTSAQSEAETRESQYESDLAKVRVVLSSEPVGKSKLRDAAAIKSSRWEYTFDRMITERVLTVEKVGRTLMCQLVTD